MTPDWSSIVKQWLSKGFSQYPARQGPPLTQARSVGRGRASIPGGMGQGTPGFTPYSGWDQAFTLPPGVPNSRVATGFTVSTPGFAPDPTQTTYPFRGQPPRPTTTANPGGGGTLTGPGYGQNTRGRSGDSIPGKDYKYLVKVKNDTAGTVLAYNPMVVEDPEASFLLAGTPPTLATGYASGLTLSAVLPSTFSHTRKVVILQQDLDAGSIGTAVWGGLTYAQVSFGASTDRYARYNSGTSQLLSAPWGPARVIWKQAGTGTKWALINLDPFWEKYRSTFAVKVTKDGGSAGTSSTACTWTYTVKDLDDNILGTSVAVQKARPNGLITEAAAGSYGVAFYDIDTLKLWDVAEVPDTDPCPP